MYTSLLISYLRHQPSDNQTMNVCVHMEFIVIQNLVRSCSLKMIYVIVVIEIQKSTVNNVVAH